MSEPSASADPGAAEFPPGQDEQIQFDQAEYSSPAARDSGAICANCRQPIADVYFEIDGKVSCPACRQRIEEAFRGGRRIARGMRALLFGMLAAIAGAILYYVVLRVTGVNWGLIAVVVGLMVGGGVRAGSGNRGGRFYQVLALFLTYSAIALMYLPATVQGMVQIWKEQQAKEQVPTDQNEPHGAGGKLQTKIAGSAGKDSAQPTADTRVGQAEDAAKPQVKGDLASKRPKSAQTKGATGEDQSGLAVLLIAPVILLVLAYIAPVIMAVQNPLSGFIYAFALWEAWKINKGLKLAFNGPFRVSNTIRLGDVPPEVVADGG
jgi:hypothetical protein